MLHWYITYFESNVFTMLQMDNMYYNSSHGNKILNLQNFYFTENKLLCFIAFTTDEILLFLYIIGNNNGTPHIITLMSI